MTPGKDHVLFELKNNRMEVLSPSPPRVHNHPGMFVIDDQVVLVAGSDNNKQALSMCSTFCTNTGAWKFNFDKNSTTSIPALPYPVASLQVVEAGGSVFAISTQGKKPVLRLANADDTGKLSWKPLKTSVVTGAHAVGIGQNIIVVSASFRHRFSVLDTQNDSIVTLPSLHPIDPGRIEVSALCHSGSILCCFASSYIDDYVPTMLVLDLSS